ncbi:MAG: four helix bundle protein [Verrucomicrobiales bacterium]|nr:four helix bundle protein [Verrucomicrobiales bacterium]
MMNDEKDLRVRTKMFARRIIRLYGALPKSNAAVQILGKQALRAGTSVGANYREAHRARSKAEFISKIGDCLKEADETLYWMELLLEENFVATGKLQPLMRENDELLAILTTISKRAKGLE